MRRPVLFAVLCLLLLAQHRGYVHPIAHLAGQASPSQETVLTSPQADQACLECALLAGGFTALSETSASPVSPAPAARPVTHGYQSRAADVPAWFQSRAPPVLL